MAIVVKENEPLAPYTIYKIGGPARFFIEVRTAQELEESVRYAAGKQTPFFIMGAGSNTLVSDKGFDGMIIHMTGGEIKIEGERMTADAGVMMARAAVESARAELAGFAWAIGVPGSIGGSVRGNAGCFGHEMKDVVERVRVLQIQSPKSKIQNQEFDVIELKNSECEFGYRDSIFKRNPEWIVLGATLKLEVGDSAAVQAEMRRMSAERAAKQDIGAKSCGCIFKNPSWERIGEPKEALIAKFPELDRFSGQDIIPAAFLIDQAGLKGKRMGRIVISARHANFFINEGGGTADEVVMLISLVKDVVRRSYRITLQEEIQYLGF